VQLLRKIGFPRYGKALWLAGMVLALELRFSVGGKQIVGQTMLIAL